jgi:membrane-associated HD superfamily phosphohydrolase
MPTPFANITSTTMTGLMQYINSTTAGLFGTAIVATVWVLSLILLHSKSPRYSFVSAGFFTAVVAVFLQLMGIMNDYVLLLSLGSFFIPLAIIAMAPARYE